MDEFMEYVVACFLLVLAFAVPMTTIWAIVRFTLHFTGGCP